MQIGILPCIFSLSLAFLRGLEQRIPTGGDETLCASSSAYTWEEAARWRDSDSDKSLPIEYRRPASHELLALPPDRRPHLQPENR